LIACGAALMGDGVGEFDEDDAPVPAGPASR
jgi:hypothetical protein